MKRKRYNIRAIDKALLNYRLLWIMRLKVKVPKVIHIEKHQGHT